MAVVMAFFFSGRLRRITMTPGWAGGCSTITWLSLIVFSSSQHRARRLEACRPLDDLMLQGGGFREKVFGGETAERNTARGTTVFGARQGALGQIGAGQHETEQALVWRGAGQRLGRPPPDLRLQQPSGRGLQIGDRCLPPLSCPADGSVVRGCGCRR